MEMEELDEVSFSAAIADCKGLAVVEFYAPWCRTCRTAQPAVDSAVRKLEADPAFVDVSFFKVNFKESQVLSLRERVFALPVMHFYVPSMGRVHSFTIKATSAGKTLRAELERYVGDSGHLQLLLSLSRVPPPLSPLTRFSLLTGFLQALRGVDKYMELGDARPAAELATDQRRLDELRELFVWIDANGDGLIDADELAAVSAAVGSFDAPAEAATLFDFYGALLGRAQAASEEAEDGDGEGEGGEGIGDSLASSALGGGTLDLEAFVRIMTSKAVTEFQTADAELRPAFEALDADGDGLISRTEMRQAMESVVTFLPKGASAGAKWADEAQTAFDALDRDKSETLDYEEFVAAMSGMRSIAPAEGAQGEEVP